MMGSQPLAFSMLMALPVQRHVSFFIGSVAAVILARRTHRRSLGLHLFCKLYEVTRDSIVYLIGLVEGKPVLNFIYFPVVVDLHLNQSIVHLSFSLASHEAFGPIQAS